jgi:hypothetical protein
MKTSAGQMPATPWADAPAIVPTKTNPRHALRQVLAQRAIRFPFMTCAFLFL